MVKPPLLEASFYVVLTTCVVFGLAYGSIPTSYFLFASLALIVGIARYVLVEVPRLRR